MSLARARSFLIRLVAVVALVGVWMPAAGTPVAAAPNTALTRYPYLTDSVQSSITVNWATDRSSTTGSVLWGPLGNCTAYTTTATKTSITVVSKSEYQWKATLPVSPDTYYCYRVRLGSVDLLGSDGTPVFVSQVAKGSTKPFSFAVFGDWGQAYADSTNPDSTNPDQANVLRQISLSGARFAIMTGDTAYQSGRQSSYGDLQQTGTDVSGVFAPNFWGVPGRSIPAFHVAGNHGYRYGDVALLNWPEENAARTSGGMYVLESYPAYNGSAPGVYPSMWYAFDAGPARFYALTAAYDDNNVGNGTRTRSIGTHTGRPRALSTSGLRSISPHTRTSSSSPSGITRSTPTPWASRRTRTCKVAQGRCRAYSTSTTSPWRSTGTHTATSATGPTQGDW